MAIVDFLGRANSFEIRGILGRPNGLGHMYCGWSHLGDEDENAGIYQKRPRSGGQIFVRMRHYWPTNPQYENQQTWRGVMADAVLAWQELSESAKLEWRRKKWPRRMSGYNRFLRQYLKSHA